MFEFTTEDEKCADVERALAQSFTVSCAIHALAVAVGQVDNPEGLKEMVLATWRASVAQKTEIELGRYRELLVSDEARLVAGLMESPEVIEARIQAAMVKVEAMVDEVLKAMPGGESCPK